MLKLFFQGQSWVYRNATLKSIAFMCKTWITLLGVINILLVPLLIRAIFSSEKDVVPILARPYS